MIKRLLKDNYPDYLKKRIIISIDDTKNRLLNM